MKKVIITVIIAAFVFGSCQQTSKQSQVNPNQEFDVVIQNGRVMDPETNFDAVRNVGVKDGKIALITEKEIKGTETIDAEGHVVAPGFIDTHYHTTDLFGAKFGLADGITTAMGFPHTSLSVKPEKYNQ